MKSRERTRPILLCPECFNGLCHWCSRDDCEYDCGHQLRTERKVVIPSNSSKEESNMSTLRINLNPSRGGGPEVDVGDFFLSIDAALENTQEGYKLPISMTAICMDCNSEIRQVYATSFGEGGLECKCSTWICPISLFSGTAYVQHKLKRVRKFSKEEVTERALEAYGIIGGKKSCD